MYTNSKSQESKPNGQFHAVSQWANPHLIETQINIKVNGSFAWFCKEFSTVQSFDHCVVDVRPALDSQKSADELSNKY